jgi:hypothetical protein
MAWAARHARSPDFTQAQKEALATVARRLALGKLTVHGRGGGDRGIYHFTSTDAGRGRYDLGTGPLGEGVGGESAYEVVLSTGSVPARRIRFNVGPPVGHSGMFLVDGTMNVTHRGTEGMSGSIKVGFANLHSTLSGTWRTVGADLGSSTLHVHLTGASPSEQDERWTWRVPPNGWHVGAGRSAPVQDDDHGWERKEWEWKHEDGWERFRGAEAMTTASCSAAGENCSSTRCCSDMDLTCYYKDETWSGCRPSCEVGEPAPPGAVSASEAAQGVWWCQDLTSHRKNTQLLLKRGFVKGTRVRAYFEGAWYAGTVVVEPETESCDKRLHPLECDRRLEWKVRCDDNSSVQYVFTNRMKALSE